MPHPLRWQRPSWPVAAHEEASDPPELEVPWWRYLEAMVDLRVTSACCCPSPEEGKSGGGGRWEGHGQPPEGSC